MCSTIKFEVLEYLLSMYKRLVLCLELKLKLYGLHMDNQMA